RRKWGRRLLWGLLLLAILLNNFQLWQIKQGILWSEDNNRAYYRAAFGKTKVTAADIAAYDLTFRQPDPDKLELVGGLHYNGFEDTTRLKAFSQKAYQGSYSFPLNGAITYSPGYSAWVDSIGLRAGDWIGVRFFARATREVHSLRKMAKMAVVFDQGNENLFWWGLRIENKLDNPKQNLWSNKPGVWREVRFWVPVPEDLPPGARLKVHGWQPHPNTIYLDEMEVTHWREK
ncbi:MAG: hypothetical protein KDC44_01280, partial [Phaeodactylibacter sp.]|nr:hypothetical protein [Phaeodactylibacter sp.]